LESENEQSLIEDEFSKSWDWMERFYEGMDAYPNTEWLKKDMLPLIAELRVQGYDRQLRAGQQLTTFVLSRSRKHGLRVEQPKLSITLKQDAGMTVSYRDSDGTSKTEIESNMLTLELETLLTRLMAHPID
jgi:hypothetical protein